MAGERPEDTKTLIPPLTDTLMSLHFPSFQADSYKISLLLKFSRAPALNYLPHSSLQQMYELGHAPTHFSGGKLKLRN